MLQGHSLATKFGHSIVDPVPSLFTFKINDPLLTELAGVNFPLKPEFVSTNLFLRASYVTLFISISQISFSKVQAKLKLDNPCPDLSNLVQVCIFSPLAILTLFKILYHKEKFIYITLFSVKIGPMLVTHWGLSGPVILRLSAWGARYLFSSKYKGLNLSFLTREFLFLLTR